VGGAMAAGRLFGATMAITPGGRPKGHQLARSKKTQRPEGKKPWEENNYTGTGFPLRGSLYLKVPLLSGALFPLMALFATVQKNQGGAVGSASRGGTQ